MDILSLVESKNEVETSIIYLPGIARVQIHQTQVSHFAITCQPSDDPLQAVKNHFNGERSSGINQILKSIKKDDYRRVDIYMRDGESISHAYARNMNIEFADPTIIEVAGAKFIRRSIPMWTLIVPAGDRNYSLNFPIYFDADDMEKQVMFEIETSKKTGYFSRNQGLINIIPLLQEKQAEISQNTTLEITRLLRFNDQIIREDHGPEKIDPTNGFES